MPDRAAESGTPMGPQSGNINQVSAFAASLLLRTQQRWLQGDLSSGGVSAVSLSRAASSFSVIDSSAH